MLTSIKGEIKSNTITVEAFHTPLKTIYRSSRHKINKETGALNDALPQIYLIDICRILKKKKIQFTFFSQGHMEHSPG